MHRLVAQLPAQSVFVGAGLLAACVLVCVGPFRAADRKAACVTLGLSGVAAIVGARLLWAIGSPNGPLRSAGSWAGLADPTQPGFWSFGGLIAGGAAAWFGARAVAPEAPWRILDSVVPAGFVSLALARLGCVPAGCDFGVRTHAHWGLRYPAGTTAWDVHLEAGLIAPTAASSLPTHPFPLYLVAVTLAAVTVGGWVAGFRDRVAGRAAFATAACYFSGRAVAEVFRSPWAETALSIGPLNLSQILAVAGFLTTSLLWKGRER